MKRCIIFAALPPQGFEKLQKGDFIIACDKGFEQVKSLGITPDLVIGDFDSLGYVPEFHNITHLPVRKDDTDTGFAIKYAVENGFENVTVYGALDGKFDHSLANVSLCAFAKQRNVNVCFKSGLYDMFAISNESVNLGVGDKRFSLFAVDKCSGVNICGADFTLNNAMLDPFFPLGVSNRQNGETVISVKSGTLIIVKYK